MSNQLGSFTKIKVNADLQQLVSHTSPALSYMNLDCSAPPPENPLNWIRTNDEIDMKLHNPCVFMYVAIKCWCSIPDSRIRTRLGIRKRKWISSLCALTDSPLMTG